MDIGLPAILLGGLAHQQGTGVSPSRYAETTKGANKFTSASENDVANNSSETTTTDNNLSNTKNKPVSHQIQEFCEAYCKGIKAVTGRSASPNTESQKPVVIKDMTLEPEDGSELAQMFAGGLPSGTKCASEQTENNPVLTVDSGNQNAGKTILTLVLAGPLIANGLVGEGKNCDETPTSGETVVSQKYLTNQVIAETAADNEMSAMADKPAVSGNQKTLVNAGLFAEQNKTLDEFGLDKSATLVNKPTDDKADTGQQAVSGIPELTESSQGNDKGRVADSILNDSLLKKLNSEQIISVNKTKDDGNSSTNNSNFEDNSPKTFKQIFSVNSAQYSGTEQSSANASALKMANTASQSDASASVGKQIQESIYSTLKQGEQQVTIRLNPPELGKVSIKLHEQDGQIIGLLEVSRAQTRTEIQQALPQIIQNLVGSGVQVKRLEVLLANQQEQQGFKDPSLAAGADGWSGQGQAGANSDSQGNNPGWVEANEWLTNDQSYASFIEPPVQITDDSINILV